MTAESDKNLGEGEVPENVKVLIAQLESRFGTRMASKKSVGVFRGLAAKLLGRKRDDADVVDVASEAMGELLKQVGVDDVDTTKVEGLLDQLNGKEVGDPQTLEILQKFIREETGETLIQNAFGVRKTLRNKGPEIGRNDPCPCGSGQKFKKCCINKNEREKNKQKK